MFSFFSKAKEKPGTVNSDNKITSAIKQIFTHKALDQEMLDEFEEQLIISDIGVKISQQITAKLAKQKFSKNISADEVKEFLFDDLVDILQPFTKKLNFEQNLKPQIIVFNGVNGSGKTTTIGKIAANLTAQKKKVLIAACDSFRAAACDQLQVWANRAQCEIFLPNKLNEDPAAIAFRATEYAKNNNFDILLIDTAGRLQNKQNLMDELKKINNVIKKIDSTAPHENILVIDSTTGQNSYSQLEVFNNAVGITGMVVTKLDGSAKGGMIFSLAQKFNKPIYAIGIGEKIDDLQEFDCKKFVADLLDLQTK